MFPSTPTVTATFFFAPDFRGTDGTRDASQWKQQPGTSSTAPVRVLWVTAPAG
ncbi:MAG: hypothetical protein JNG84_11810 [Archangium sp.]|nr:hypothetical protein [Archangium sp.]